MKILSFIDFLKKYNLKDDTMNNSQIQKVCNYPIYSRDSKIFSDRQFANLDNGVRGGSHGCAYYVKDKKSYYLHSSGGQLDKFLLDQLNKPITYHIYKIKDINSKLCASNCLYFFYLIERMNYYDAILKMYFNTINAN